MSDFNFCSGAYEAASPTQDKQRLINWYPEVDKTKKDNPGTQADETQRGVIALYPTPGLLRRLTLAAAAEVRGLHVVPGGQTLLAVSGNKFYSVTTSYVATLRGTLNTSSGRVYIEDNDVSAYLTDGTDRYTYNLGTGAFATIVAGDGAFTGGGVCGGMDNYIFYNRPFTNQWGCTSVGVTTSNTLNLGEKIGASDNIVTLVADHRQVLLLGEKTSERWINNGTFPFPFGILDGSSIQHGCQARDSIARLGEGVAFLALDDRGNATVVMWGATIPAPLRISTFAIENAIQGYSATSDAIAYSYSQAGHEFYVLTFPTADVTWVYDLATDMWHQRAWRDSNNVYHRHRSNCAEVFNGEVIVGDWQNGKLYALSQTKYTDDGDILPCVRTGPHITADLKRIFFHDLQVQFQPGVGLQVDDPVNPPQGSDPDFLLRWSDDGGFTFGNDHSVKIGQVGQYRNRAIKRRLGYARDRVFEIEITDPVYRVVVSANLNYTVGAA